MAKPKNQHWVPRFYLRTFSTPETRESKNPQVWIFHKERGDPQLTNVKNIAAKRFLYSPKGLGRMRDWQMEERLQQIETPLSSVWARLATDFIDFYSDEALRKAMALMVATLILRHPTGIEEVKDIHTQLVAIFEQCPKDEYGNPMVAEVENQGVPRPFDNTGYIKFREADSYDFHRAFVQRIFDNAGWLAQELLKKRWWVSFTDTPSFITTDTPVVVVNAERQSFGINTPGTVLSFPISPTRVLMMDDRWDHPKGRYYPVGKDGTAPFNYTAWCNCESFMISPRSTDLVCAEMLGWTNAFERNS